MLKILALCLLAADHGLWRARRLRSDALSNAGVAVSRRHRSSSSCSRRKSPSGTDILGLAASVQPAYSGASQYRASGGTRHQHPLPRPGLLLHRRRARRRFPAGKALSRLALRRPRPRPPRGVGHRPAAWSRGHSTGALLQALGRLRDLEAGAHAFCAPTSERSRAAPRGSSATSKSIRRFPAARARFVMFAGPSVTVADRKHLQTGYGISPLQSLRVRLPGLHRPRRAGGGGVRFQRDALLHSPPPCQHRSLCE